MSESLLSDALADALGQIVAECQKAWLKEVEIMSAQTKAMIAELRAEHADYRSDLKDTAAAEIAKITDEAKSRINGLRDGVDGKDADPEVIKTMVEAALAKVPAPRDGNDADPDQIAAAVEKSVQAAIADLPVPKDGKDFVFAEHEDAISAVIAEQTKAGLVGIERQIDDAVSKALAGIKIEKAASITLEDVNAAIEAGIAKLPVPKDGTSVDPDAVKAMVESAVAGAGIADLVAAGIAEIKAEIAEIPIPKDGVSVDPETVKTMVESAVAGAGIAGLVEAGIAEIKAEIGALPVPKDGIDGKDADPQAIADILKDSLVSIVEALPVPQDGKSVDQEVVIKMVADAIAQIRVPQDGKSVEPAEVDAMIKAAVAEAFATVPPPRDGNDGRDVDMAEVTEIIKATVAELPKPQDGRSVEPEAVLEMVKGEVAKITIPVPQDGKDADIEVIRDMVKAAIDAIPAPQDGKSVTMDEVRPVIDQAVAEIKAAAEAQIASIPVPVAPTLDMVEIDRTIAKHLTDAVEAKQPDLESRIDAKIKAVADAIPVPQDGRSVEIDDVRPILDGLVKDAVAAIRFPEDGRSVEPAEIEAMVKSAVDKIEIPKPRDGNDADPNLIVEAVAAAIDKAIPDAVKAYAGDLITGLDDIEIRIEKAVEAAAGKIVVPVPKDGTSVTIEDATPVLAELVEKAVAGIKLPEPGPGIKDFIIDRDGHLVITMTDGSTVPKGKIVGNDVDPDAVAEMIKSEVAKIPVPKDGADGIGFDDMQVDYDGRRTVSLVFTKGDVMKEAKMVFPMIIDCGVYKEGIQYETGDGVSWAGSYWIAQQDTDSRPETDDTWRLSIKRGRDGRESVKLPRPTGPVKA